MLVMFIGLVSGVCKVTWSVLRDRKISLLSFWVEILLPNATNRTGDLWYVEFIAWSCLCNKLHCLSCGPEWGAERRQGCCTPAYSAVAPVALWSQTQRHRHVLAHGSVSCEGNQLIGRPLWQGWQMHDIHVASVLLAAMDLAPNHCQALCFCQLLFFPCLKIQRNIVKYYTYVTSFLWPNLVFFCTLFFLNTALYTS